MASTILLVFERNEFPIKGDTMQHDELTQNILDNTKDECLKAEVLKAIDDAPTTKIDDAGQLSCGYCFGACMVDGGLRKIHKRKYPNYFNFLYEWYHN